MTVEIRLADFGHLQSLREPLTQLHCQFQGDRGITAKGQFKDSASRRPPWEMPHLLRDLVLTRKVSQICRLIATHLDFRWHCVFCTFCDVSISTEKSPAETTSSCSESEGSCHSFSISFFTEATRRTIQAVVGGRAHTELLFYVHC